MIGGSKSKTAFTDGYFEKKFDRIMEVKDMTSFLMGGGGTLQACEDPSDYRLDL